MVDEYGSWRNRKLIGFFLRYCETVFFFKDGENQQQTVYQATHHMFVANSLAIKLCHEIIPEAKIGCRLSLSNVYPYTCNPNNVFETMELRRRSLFFGDELLSDVDARVRQAVLRRYRR